MEVFLPRYRSVPVPQGAKVSHRLAVPDPWRGGSAGTTAVAESAVRSGGDAAAMAYWIFHNDLGQS
mgnify:CR=1 FL=1